MKLVFFAFVLDRLFDTEHVYKIYIQARIHHFFHYHCHKKAYTHSHNNQFSLEFCANNAMSCVVLFSLKQTFFIILEL